MLYKLIDMVFHIDTPQDTQPKTLRKLFWTTFIGLIFKINFILNILLF
jgi:hypothetical protein